MKRLAKAMQRSGRGARNSVQQPGLRRGGIFCAQAVRLKFGRRKAEFSGITLSWARKHLGRLVVFPASENPVLVLWCVRADLGSPGRRLAEIWGRFGLHEGCFVRQIDFIRLSCGISKAEIAVTQGQLSRWCYHESRLL